jgi:hypothetical protein
MRRRRRTNLLRGGAYADGLDSIESTTCFDLDGRISQSYSGSGTDWLNMVVSPSDGSAQSDYDMTIGSGVTHDGSGFSMDGTANSRMRVASNTAFFEDIHKSTGTTDFWIAMTINLPASGDQQILFATNTGGAGDSGLRAMSNGGAGVLFLQQGNGTTNTNANCGGTLNNTGEHTIIISREGAGTNTRHWIDTDTASDVSHTYNTSTAAASGLATTGATADNGTTIDSGGIITSFAMGDGYLDNTRAAAIRANLEAR